MNFRQSVTIAELWRQVARCCKNSFFCVFLENDPLWKNFQNCVPKGFIASPIDMLYSNFVKFGCRLLIWQKQKKQNFASLSDLATAQIVPKICHSQPPRMYSSAPDFIPIGSLSAELYPNTRTPSKQTVKCFQHSVETYLRIIMTKRSNRIKRKKGKHKVTMMVV